MQVVAVVVMGVVDIGLLLGQAAMLSIPACVSTPTFNDVANPRNLLIPGRNLLWPARILLWNNDVANSGF
jgi:hypothetical protein